MRHLDRSNRQFHRLFRSGETPAFCLVIPTEAAQGLSGETRLSTQIKNCSCIYPCNPCEFVLSLSTELPQNNGRLGFPTSGAFNKAITGAAALNLSTTSFTREAFKALSPGR